MQQHFGVVRSYCIISHTRLCLPLFLSQTFCILIDDDIDVGTLKKKILDHARATGGSPSTLFMSKDIFLVWNGRPLDEEMLLKDYNMTKNATIYVSYRNKGGCFMVSLSILTTICAALVGSTCTCGLSLFIIPLLLPFLFVLPFFCL